MLRNFSVSFFVLKSFFFSAYFYLLLSLSQGQKQHTRMPHPFKLILSIDLRMFNQVKKIFILALVTLNAFIV